MTSTKLPHGLALEPSRAKEYKQENRYEFATCHELYFMIRILLYFIESICWLNVSSEMSAELKSSASFTIGVPKFQVH